MELLAPAGTREGFLAVLAQKPDVIYLGAGDMNARSSEAQLALDELGELVGLARQKNVKIYFTLNILVKDSEFARALEIAGIAKRAGVAALIVQDKGLMALLNETYPDMVIHASTQCSIGSREQIREMRAFGVRRIVLARELSLEQIADLTRYAHSLGMEVEVFTHGATCMSVSGQCHMSFCIGGRSANRGACAQPCRKRYRLLQGDSELRGCAAWLSPKDLSYFPYLKELAEIQVDSLKIEGRLRSSEYQAQVTAIFKTAITEIEKGLPDREIFTRERKRNLEIAFNRGGSFQAAFLKSKRDAGFLSSEQVAHQGYHLGEVKRVRHHQGILVYTPRETDYLPAEGSQISLKNSSGTTVATAPVGIVHRGTAGAKEVELLGFHPQILQRLRLPLSVWQQKQERVPEQDLREAAKEPLRLAFRKAGEDYVLEMKSARREARFSSAELEARPQETGSPLDLSRIEQQLCKLGSTPYEAVGFETDLRPEECPSWHISELNAFRRAAIGKLTRTAEILPGLPPPAVSAKEAKPSSVQSIAYLPNYQAGDSLSGLDGREHELIVLPLEELSMALKADPQLRALRKELGEARLGAYLAPLNAWSCRESREQALHSLTACGLAALVSSTSGTAELVEDIGLDLEIFLWQGGQVSNSKSYEFFARRGYHGLMISPELSFREQTELAKRFGQSAARPILLCHGPMEAMFTRFCPIGYSGKCGLCRKSKTYRLQDEDGRFFPLTPKLYADCSLQIWHGTTVRQGPECACIRAYNFVTESAAEIREFLNFH